MSQEYSDPARAGDPHALPDIEIFQLTATEVAERDEELIYEYLKRPEFRLASMNGRDRERMLDAIVKEEGIEGGWFYWHCFPGFLPDNKPSGPYNSYVEALSAARGDAAG